MKKFLSTTLFAVIIAASVQAQEKLKFKLTPKQGTINYEMVNKTDITGTQEIMMDMFMNMSLTPGLLTDSSINMEVKYTKIKMDMNAGMMMMSYDSSVESQDEMGKALGAQLAPMLANSITMEMGLDGKVINIEAPKDLGQAFDKSSLESLTPSFPKNEISIGDSWNASKSMAELGATAEMTNTLIEKTAEGYKVEIKGVFLNQTGAEIGKINGHYIIDPITHFTKSSSTNTSLDIQGQKISVSTELKQVN